MTTPPCIVPRYERTTTAPSMRLTEQQGYILLLCSVPHTLSHIVSCLDTLYQLPMLHEAWADIVYLHRKGFLRIHAPEIAPRVPRTNVPEYQFKPAYRRLAA